jgi:hypothetical protein
MRKLFGLGAARNRLYCAGSPEVGEGALFEIAEGKAPDIAEVVAERVARVGRAAAVPENVRLAMELCAQAGNIGL